MKERLSIAPGDFCTPSYDLNIKYFGQLSYDFLERSNVSKGHQVTYRWK